MPVCKGVDRYFREKKDKFPMVINQQDFDQLSKTNKNLLVKILGQIIYNRSQSSGTI